MLLTNALLRNLSVVKPPAKKQRMLKGTPLKHFLRPIMEESMKRQMMGLMQQMPQLGTQSSPMVEPPSVNPLQNALMSMGQGGVGGTQKPQGGMTGGTQ